MDTEHRSDTGFHAGERAVQERAGVRAMADRVGASIHTEVPPAAQDFLARQPLVVIGYADAAGRLWASALTGPPGFARALDAHTVGLGVRPTAGDPLQDAWHDGTDVGLLAIEPATRRRMRVNGRLAWGGDGRMTVAVRQAYANCPKYIQARAWEQTPVTTQAPLPERGERLTAAQRQWIAGADTFFIATAHAEAGADVSHRGGAPGFVQVTDPTTLAFPDYAGNNMFNTLGNLTTDPHAGLLFVDLTSGDTLQITGEARVVWEAARAAAFPGAQRVVEFQVTEVCRTPHAVPLRWRFLEASPFNP